jgi:hypothetical protein
LPTMPTTFPSVASSCTWTLLLSRLPDFGSKGAIPLSVTISRNTSASHWKSFFSYCISVCINWLIDWLIEHLYSAHLHSIECSGYLADVLACSQKVSHPEMRLVSAFVSSIIPGYCPLSLCTK